MPNPKPYPHHPFADLFPMMEGDAQKELADDIEANGLYDHIWLYEGKVLDGRNRQKSCFERDVDPKYQEYKGKDPLGFVISKNMARRHLSESQRALVAAKLITAKKGGQPGSDAKPETVKSAAAKLNVSPTTVKAAKKVRASGSAELVKAVEQGKVTVTAAAEAAKLTPAEQKKLTDAGPEAIKDHAANTRANKPVQTRPMPHQTPRGTAKRKAARGLGGEKFTFAAVEKPYGLLTRAVDDMAAAHDVTDGRSHETAREKLGDLLSYLKTWHNREQKKDSE